MRVDVKLNGMEEVGEAMNYARACMKELDDAVSAVYAAMRKVGMEIHQPPEEAGKEKKTAPAAEEQEPVKLGPGVLIVPNAG